MVRRVPEDPDVPACRVIDAPAPMLDSKSVKARFLFSLGSNAARAVLGFLSGLLIARGLNPSGYGDLMFLLGSFAAVRSLLDMGSSSAFYTFISQRRRTPRFFLAYFLWLGLQFLITGLLIAVLMPRAAIEAVWLGKSRPVILLAFAASFFQQQVWLTLTQVGESSRKTIRVQLLGVAVGLAHLVLVVVLLLAGRLSVSLVLWVLILEYAAAAILSHRFFGGSDLRAGAPSSGPATYGSIAAEYWRYCRPMILLSWVTFLCEFADRWLLQRFGGAHQQGYYQVAFQFAAVSLLATSSILNVFWKEIAEAHARRDMATVSSLYRIVNRGMVMLGAMVSGFLIPWAGPIVEVFLGRSYASATAVLMVMFLYPIHQSMGQIGGTMLLAEGQTRTFTKIGILGSVASVPLSYLVQAPRDLDLLPGLGLGALGMALKIVVLNVVSVNLQAWVIARNNGWRYDWVYQPAAIGATVAIGFLCRWIAGNVWNLGTGGVRLLLPVLASGILYALLVIGFVWRWPSLIAMERKEVRSLLANVTFLR